MQSGKWQYRYIDEGRLERGEYSARVRTSSKEYVRITNKLVKKDEIGTYIIYKEGFKFPKYRIEYGRFGKRHDVPDGEMTLDEMLANVPDVSSTYDILSLPKVPKGPLKELMDDER